MGRRVAGFVCLQACANCCVLCCAGRSQRFVWSHEPFSCFAFEATFSLLCGGVLRQCESRSPDSALAHCCVSLIWPQFALADCKSRIVKHDAGSRRSRNAVIYQFAVVGCEYSKQLACTNDDSRRLKAGQECSHSQSSRCWRLTVVHEPHGLCATLLWQQQHANSLQPGNLRHLRCADGPEIALVLAGGRSCCAQQLSAAQGCLYDRRFAARAIGGGAGIGSMVDVDCPHASLPPPPMPAAATADQHQRFSSPRRAQQRRV